MEIKFTLRISLPTILDPVKLTLLTNLCLHRYSPATGPYPGTILKTPLGNPASFIREPNFMQVRGVTSEGFNTMQQPAAKAGANFQSAINSG
jgi:hypothetical protein